MFLSWYSVEGLSDETQEQAEAAIELAEEQGIEVPEGAQDAVDDAGSISAWDAFDLIKIVMLLTIIAAIAMAAMTAMGSTVNMPIAMSALVAGLGILTTLLVLYRVIDPPAEGLDRSYGVFLGLIASAAIAYGGWRAMEDEGTSFGDVGAGTSGGAPAPPPAPPAAPPPADAPPPSQQPPAGPGRIARNPAFALTGGRFMRPPVVCALAALALALALGACGGDEEQPSAEAAPLEVPEGAVAFVDEVDDGEVTQSELDAIVQYRAISQGFDPPLAEGTPEYSEVLPKPFSSF